MAEILWKLVVVVTKLTLTKEIHSPLGYVARRYARAQVDVLAIVVAIVAGAVVKLSAITCQNFSVKLYFNEATHTHVERDTGRWIDDSLTSEDKNDDIAGY